MNAASIALLYVAIGLACGVAIFRRTEDTRAKRITAAALAIPLWPLWAPIALTSTRSVELESEQPPTRIRSALLEAAEACRGTAMEALLSPAVVSRLCRQVDATSGRLSELAIMLTDPAFDRASAEQRVASLSSRYEAMSPDDEGRDELARTLATARVQLDSTRRLDVLLQRDRAALAELSDLANALRTQILLCQYSGSSAEGLGDIVTEVRARVEGLGAAMDDVPIEVRV